MSYELFQTTSPKMPKLGKGTEILNLLLSQVSKDMREPLVPIVFPILGAHMCGTEFQYPDLTWKECCGIMAHLCADSGCNKGQLSVLMEAIMRSFREHDSDELDKLKQWQRSVKTKAANRQQVSDVFIQQLRNLLFHYHLILPYKPMHTIPFTAAHHSIHYGIRGLMT